MKKIVMFATAAGAALALAACGAKQEEAPAEPAETADAEMMMPAEEAPTAEAAAKDDAAEAAEGLDPTGNPIGPGAPAPGTNEEAPAGN
jgi:hypothetical protein